MVAEARLEAVASGLAPVTPGWFVFNAADAAWCTNDEWSGVCIFESDEFVLRGRPDLSEYVKPQAGFTIRVIPPGKPGGLYQPSRSRRTSSSSRANACSSSKTRSARYGRGTSSTALR